MEHYSSQRLTAVTNLTTVVFGLTITAVLQNPDFARTERDLACLEMFSGPFGRIACAAAAAGRPAAIYDSLFESGPGRPPGRAREVSEAVAGRRLLRGARRAARQAFDGDLAFVPSGPERAELQV